MRKSAARSVTALVVTGAVVVVGVGAVPVADATTWSKRCSAGLGVFNDHDTLRVFTVRVGGRMRLAFCTVGFPGPRTVSTPQALTRIVADEEFPSADGQRALIGVLATTRTPAGAGAIIVAFDNFVGSGKVVADIGPEILRGHRVVQFALEYRYDVAAVLLDSGDVVALDTTQPGLAPRTVGRAVGPLNRVSLGLDPNTDAVEWWPLGGIVVHRAVLFPPPACEVPGQEIVGTPQVRVFASAAWGRRLYACDLTTRRVRELRFHTDALDQRCPGAGCAFKPIEEAGIKVAGAVVNYAFAWSDEFGRGRTLMFLDIASGRMTEISDKTPHVLADSGVLAYLDSVDYGGERGCRNFTSLATTRLVVVDASGPRVIDCRDDPKGDKKGITDLRLDGRVLTWRARGRLRTTTLR